MRVSALSIAGFDPSGGAGVLLDLAVFRAHGVHGAAAITAITAQDSRGVKAVFPLSPEWIEQQAQAVLSDLPVRAIKIGMLGGGPQALCVASILDRARDIPVVLDPVLSPKHGLSLIDAPGIEVMRERLFPLATLVTPNVSEAERLSGVAIRDRASLRSAARALLALGPRAVLIKGLRDGDGVVDLLVETGQDGEFEQRRRWIDVAAPHGTGCALSSAVAAGLASGQSLGAAVSGAQREVHLAIGLCERIGHGSPFLRIPEVTT